MLGVIFFTSTLRSSCAVLGIFKNRKRERTREIAAAGWHSAVKWEFNAAFETQRVPTQLIPSASGGIVLRGCALVKRYDPALARSHRKPLRVHTVTGLLEPPLGVMRQRNAGTLSVMPAHSSSVTRCVNIQEVHTHTWYINVTWCSVRYIYVYILTELARYNGADFTTEIHLQSQIPLGYKNRVLRI